jgi:hypothetical protein
MKILPIILSLAFLFTATIQGQEWSGTYTGGKGVRLDYTPQNGGLKDAADSSSQIYHFKIDAKGKAVVSLAERKENAKPEFYSLQVLQRTEEPIVMQVIPNTGAKTTDRFQLLSIFPKSGIGFCTTTSAYLMGTPELRAIAVDNPNIPVASVTSTALFRLD